MRRERRRRRFFPQADRNARGLPRGAAGALRDRGAARTFGDEAREARATVVTRPARKAAVDDDAHVFQRDAGLGDAGREDELALAGRRRSERLSLRGGLDAAVELVQLDIGESVPSASAVRSISATPGRKASSEPSWAARAARIADAICGSMRATGSRPA